VVLVPGLVLAPINFKDMSAVTLAVLNISANVLIGTTDTTSANYFGYWEIGAGTSNISTPDGTSGTGSGRIKLNIATAGAVVNVAAALSAPADLYSQTVRILLNDSGAVLNVTGSATVGLATNMAGETSTVGIVNVSGGGIVTLGPGVTYTTGDVQTGSKLYTNSSGTTLNVASGGNLYTAGNSTIATITNSGNAVLNHRPTSGNNTINSLAGTIDFSQNPGNMTVTILNLYPSILKRSAANPAHITISTLNQFGCGQLTAS
jgi:hypothetical protein